MKTYIANCTMQNQQINVRLQETRKPLSITIPMGSQRLIGDLDSIEIKALEEQLGPYGLVASDEIGKSRKKITYVYATERPVSAAQIMKALDANKGILHREGEQRRKESAVAANAGMNTEETPLNRLEMSVEEDTSGSIPSEKPIGEGFRIDNTLSTSENKPPRRRGGRA